MAQIDPKGLSHVFGSSGAICDGKPFLQLKHKLLKTGSVFECISCPDEASKFTMLNQISKHISKDHCSKQLACLICEPDSKG